MKKKILLLIIVILAVIICFFAFKKENKENETELTLYGNIEIRQIDLSFQVPGLVSKLLKEEGDTVKKGELVAVMDESDYDANFKRAAAEVDRTLATQKDAVDKYNRYAPLGVDDTVSKQEVESLYNAQNKANADYKAAVANKDYLSNQLKYTKLYAPEDGTIMVRVVEPGSNVQKGQPVYTMAKTNPVWVRAYINEKELGNIKYGQKVNVYTDTVNPQTGEKREYKGQIGYISPVAEFTPKTVQSTDTRSDLVYRIRVYINDIDEYLRQGMPVTIKVNLGVNENPSPQPSPQRGEGV
jgi:HlyD family secretion protein